MVQTMVSNKFTDKSYPNGPWWIGCPKVLLQPPHAWQLRYAEGDSNAATEFFGFHDLWAEGRGLNVADLRKPAEAFTVSSVS